MRLLRRPCWLWCAAWLFVLPDTAWSQTGDFPRLANMYLHGSVDPSEIPALAQWDMLILSTAWTQEDLQSLRALNPDILIFLYVCSYCPLAPPPASDPWQVGVYNYAAVNDLWWYDRSSRIASDWPGSRMVNITEKGYAGPQGTWRQFMAQQIESLVASRPAMDGVFLDNYWRAASWNQGRLQLDSDCNPTHNPAGCDGVMDTNAELDSIWNRALRTLAVDLRVRFDGLEQQRGRPLALHSNRAADYFPWLNGTLYEFFPSGWSAVDPGNPYGYNWNEEMFAIPQGYLTAAFQTDPMYVSVLNADWTETNDQPDRTAEFERHKRFTFASALLGDGYYSLDAGDQNGHGSLWWEPEYDHDGRGTGYLGQAMGPMQRIAAPTGPEKISNGDFSNVLNDWLSQPYLATGSVAWDSADFHSAPGAARITVTSMSASNSNYKLYQSLINLTQGTDYTLQFWARAEPAQTMVVHLFGDSCPLQRCLADQTLALTSEWQKFTISFQATGSTANAGLNLFAQQVGQIWVDDVSLKEGDSSVYRRDFENGVVLLNYTADPVSVDLQSDYERLDVVGSAVFDGATVQQETVPPWDARILLTATSGGNPPTDPVPPSAPEARLEQNIPNPFNPGTQIHFELTRQEPVLLEVYDIGGRRVRTLVDRVMPGATEHTVTWNGRDQFNRAVPSGIYLYRLRTPSLDIRRKMTLLR